MGVVVPNLWAHLRYNKDSPDSQKWELYDGAYEIYGKFDGAEDAETLEMMPFGTATAKWKDPQFAKVDDVASSNWVERSFVPATRKVNGQPLTKDITVQGMTDNALVLDGESVKTYDGAAVSAAAIGAYTRGEIDGQVLNASNPTFSNEVATVARTVTPPPSPTLRIFDEVRQCYWIGRMVDGVINWEVE